MKEIYLDNSASTQVDPRVLESMLPFFGESYGNPSSSHTFGQTAMAAVDESRAKIADYLNCVPQEIIFTSGATESNNIAIMGVVNHLSLTHNKVHIITSKIEHPAVLEVFRYYENKRNGVEVTYIDVDEFGVVKLDMLEKSIKDNTVLISIMYANNEVGSIQPIKEIRALIDAEKEKRGEKDLPLYLHVDAVQAFNYLSTAIPYIGADLMSFSGHKIYGPKGIGGLFIRKGVKIQPIVHGGHHEYGIRPGTLNVPGIVGLGKAVSLIAEDREKNFQKIKKIKSKLLCELEKIDNIKLNGNGETQLPNIINISFLNAEGESIMMLLDMQGIYVSTGSACSSGSLEPSHVLTAMGNPPEWSHGSIRISLGQNNNDVEVPVIVKALKEAVEKLRNMAP
jgi:cysteine desulfurase